MNADALSNLMAAVPAYFQGERREMLSIIAVSAVLAVVVIAFFVITRDGFSKGFMITVLMVAGMLSATAVSLLVRDHQLSQALVSGLAGDTVSTTVRNERARIAAVLANYPRYRWVAVAVGLVALSMLVMSHRHWLHGVAAGLLLLVVAQVIIDRYSERRATSYLESIVRALPVR